MKKFFSEFKTFISRGNVIDMAVGIVVGGAFTAIINAFVADIITPIISLIIGNISFTDLKVVFKAAEMDGDVITKAEVALTYGHLIEQIINFLLIAFVLFVFVKVVNKFREKAEKEIKAKQEKENAEKIAAEKAAAEAAAAEAAAEAERLAAIPTKDQALLMEIRDLLKAQAK